MRPRTATMLDRPVGQWLSNLRRPGALDRHPEWQTALEAVDPDWNPVWPADWQRHYVALRELVADEADQAAGTDILPGVTVHGMDIGKWLARQQTPKVWRSLTAGQRERLEALGITLPASAPVEPDSSAEGPTAPVSAFEKGLATLAQYKSREGSVGRVSRSHIEVLPDGTEVRLGVFLSNTKSRRAKLAPGGSSSLPDLDSTRRKEVKWWDKFLDK